MEKYPYLNQAVGNVLSDLRGNLDMSKRKLGEIAMVERAYITGLENGKWNMTLNAMFYFSEALGVEPEEFIRMVRAEIEILKDK